MNKIGLTSITFRHLNVETIIELVKEAQLDVIEWGADVHVLPNDLKNAKHVKGLMDDAKLITSSYGSYYQVGCQNEYSFEEVLAVAKILKAKDIRVWAGSKGSLEASFDDRQKIVKDSIRIATLASLEGIRVSFEYHDKTLTDTVDSALALLKEVNHHNIYLYWQPPVALTSKQCLADLNKIKGFISNVHVFSWDVKERLPLSHKMKAWQEYIESITADQNVETRYFLLEFVKGDSIEQFKRDAKTLHQLVY